MTEQIDFMFMSGVVMGLSGGFAPGPLTTFVLSQSLMYGRGEGIKAGLAPLVTDAPIILFSMWLLGRMAGTEWFLGAISLTGALVLFYYGLECLRFTSLLSRKEALRPRSLGKAIWVNFLNPHPYLFWATVGAPLLTRSLSNGWSRVFWFLAGFYGALVGAKVLLASVAGLLANRWGTAVRWMNRFLGLCLWLLAAALAREGLTMLAGATP